MPSKIDPTAWGLILFFGIILFANLAVFIKQFNLRRKEFKDAVKKQKVKAQNSAKVAKVKAEAEKLGFNLVAKPKDKK